MRTVSDLPLSCTTEKVLVLLKIVHHIFFLESSGKMVVYLLGRNDISNSEDLYNSLFLFVPYSQEAQS